MHDTIIIIIILVYVHKAASTHACMVNTLKIILYTSVQMLYIHVHVQPMPTNLHACLRCRPLTITVKVIKIFGVVTQLSSMRIM